MNYYPHHIGDYRSDTAYLTLLEHGVYRQLLDWYYLDEQPIPRKTQLVMRRLSAKTPDEKTAVENVLQDFFELTDDGFEHRRCKQELEKYRLRAETAKRNGIKGGRPIGSLDRKPRKTKSVNLANPEKPSGKLTNNQEPLTKNIKDPPPPPQGGRGAGQSADASNRSSGAGTGRRSRPKGKSKPKGLAGFDEFYACYPRKQSRRDAERAWAGLAPDEALRKTLHAALDAQKHSPQWRKDDGGYIPLPATWINGRRWEDEIQSARATGGDAAVERMLRAAL